MLKQAKTSQLISDIVKRIRRDCEPDKIILFGSYAKGTPRFDSDIDLLVIKESNLRRDERDKEIRKSLRDIKFPLDIFVYTPREVAEYSNLKGSFISAIFREGQVIYPPSQNATAFKAVDEYGFKSRGASADSAEERCRRITPTSMAKLSKRISPYLTSRGKLKAAGLPVGIHTNFAL